MQAAFKNPIFTSPGASPFLARSNPRPPKFQSSILCARKRRQPFMNQKASKLMLDAALTVASNLNIVPPTVTALIRELGGGNGGGFGSRKGAGGGGFGWWRRRARNLGFVLLVVVVGLGLCAGEKLHQRNDVVWCGLGLPLFAGVISLSTVRIGDWVLGFCTCAFFLGFLGLRKENMTKLLHKFRASVSGLWSMKMIRVSKNKRRAF